MLVRCDLAVVMVTLMVVTAGDGARVVSGQTVCPVPGEPCYKMAYFRSVTSRVSFSEAVQACDTDKGALLSIESEEEQRTIERLLKELRSGAGSDSGITDGDFWIGLTRTETWDQNQTQSCPGLYQWTDGSSATYRHWYEDEPSCGGEACVVMYHQPTALPGVGGAYLHQWNDDRCNMKHNFICKYHPDSELRTHSDSPHLTVTTESTPEKEKEAPPQTQDTDSGTLLLYIVIPTIPLLLLILVASGSCCCQRLHHTKSRSKTPADQSNLWISSSPKAHV
ncbi:chondrolectin [Periophthalmus magnuspinnatus]|uniref:chondrolectin n=1 Tax=Periophthalmus magnuspinnatus TaxID=409849 RepID=UPI0024364FA9|nr:chondrolectin [Periophthalmus magnuspinnatus]